MLDVLQIVSVERAIEEIFGIALTNADGTIAQFAVGPSLLGAFSHIINSAALTVATVLIVWSTLSATVNTASEGKWLGQRYHGVWVPLRSAVAIAMMLPVVQGYSLIQVSMLLLAQLGFQSADLAWKKALDYLRNEGPVINYTPAHTEELAVAMFQSNVCMQRTNALYFRGVKRRRVQVVQSDRLTADKELHYRLSFDGVNDSHLGDGVCGEFSIVHQDTSLGRVMYAGNREALRRLWADTNQLSLSYVSSGDTQRIIPALQQAITVYNNYLTKVAAQAVSNGEGAMQEANRNFFATAKESGWLMAGAWFWNLGAVNRQIADALTRIPRVQQPDLTTVPIPWQEVLNRDMLTIGIVLSDADTDGFRFELHDQGSGSLHDKVAAWTHKPMIIALEYVNTLFNGDGEPMVRLQSFGHGMIGVAEALLAGAVLGKALASGALYGASENIFAQIADVVSFGGGKLEFAKKAGNTLLEWATWIIASFALPILFTGLMFAFWLPAAPFVYWFVAVVGWLILLLEAILIIPLWAAAHAAAEGEGMVSYYARPGYMLVLTLLARPLMMVIGLFAAMYISHFGSSFLLHGFAPFVKGMHAGQITGIVSTIVMLMILMILIVALINRSYSLIYLLPEKIFEYISDMPGVGSSQLAGDSRAQFNADVKSGRQLVGNSLRQIPGKSAEVKKQRTRVNWVE